MNLPGGETKIVYQHLLLSLCSMLGGIEKTYMYLEKWQIAIYFSWKSGK